MEPMLVRRLLLTALLSAAAATGCSGHGAVSQDVGGSNGYQSGNLALDYIAVSARHAPPTVSGTLLDGQHFDLAQWRGKVVVVNFWGSWCDECRAEALALQQVSADDKAKGVEFLGINVRDDIPSAQKYDEHFGVTYPSLFDPSSLLALRFRGVPPNATPTTIVLDRHGRVAARQSGEIFYTQLRDLVDRVVKEPSA